MVHIMWETFQKVIKMASAAFMNKILKNLYNIKNFITLFSISLLFNSHNKNKICNNLLKHRRS